MFRSLLLLLLLSPFSGSLLHAQEKTAYPTPPPNEEGKVYNKVDQVPEFPGGQDKLYQFLGEHIQYPRKSHKHNIEGTVYLHFVVNTTGAIQDIKVVKGVDGGDDLAEECIRVIKLMPKWKPGYISGEAVLAGYDLPVKFKLTEPAAKKK